MQSPNLKCKRCIMYWLYYYSCIACTTKYTIQHTVESYDKEYGL